MQRRVVTLCEQPRTVKNGGPRVAGTVRGSLVPADGQKAQLGALLGRWEGLWGAKGESM